MKELIEFAIINTIVWIVFYFLMSFLFWDINLFDDMVSSVTSRIITLIFIVFSFLISLKIYEEDVF